jgi:hypothetical protein
MRAEAVFAVVFAVCVAVLALLAAARLVRDRPRMSRARVIIPATVLTAVLLTSTHELMFGAGTAGLPTTLLAATIGGAIWGAAFAAIAAVARKAGS